MIRMVVKITVPCKSGISLVSMALTARRPMPGTPNTLSVSTAPDSMLDTCSAIMVTTGSMAFFSACFTITPDSSSPLARAVRIKSFCIISTRLERVMRAMLPAEFQPSTMAGRIMARKESKPETGNHLNLNANRYCSTSAVMNTGMETPISAPPINRRSSSLFCRTAAMMPATIPMIQATTAASRDNFTVFGNASRIIFVTFRFSR